MYYCLYCEEATPYRKTHIKEVLFNPDGTPEGEFVKNQQITCNTCGEEVYEFPKVFVTKRTAQNALMSLYFKSYELVETILYTLSEDPSTLITEKQHTELLKQAHQQLKKDREEVGREWFSNDG